MGIKSKNTFYYIKQSVMACHQWLYEHPNLVKLGGKFYILEFDEALMGKKHGPLAFGNNNKTMKLWCFGMAEREKGERIVDFSWFQIDRDSLTYNIKE